ncbi:26S proteasome non-ATPase regulatory subunit 9 [Tieghemiomyces parasiticus]|uniref:26S proteasome non-ATPase regulatory subunit 9 n=1 Tax=Tieghemiomyces parasiticus TaxID=78921 RepID=A0A9W8DZJ4_9FUNG|nr:26S proteasome non-ATPase regulatory subunit 9 [Tieghemiomyces parasiticus]
MEAAQQLLARKDTIERQLRSLENSLREVSALTSGPKNRVTSRQSLIFTQTNDRIPLLTLPLRLPPTSLLLEQQGVGLTDPLVDREDFPRSDIDVSAIRLARVRIIELRNDLKNTVGDIEQCLYQLHNVPVGATQSEAPAASHDGK